MDITQLPLLEVKIRRWLDESMSGMNESYKGEKKAYKERYGATSFQSPIILLFLTTWQIEFSSHW